MPTNLEDREVHNVFFYIGSKEILVFPTAASAFIQPTHYCKSLGGGIFKVISLNVFSKPHCHRGMTQSEFMWHELKAMVSLNALAKLSCCCSSISH